MEEYEVPLQTPCVYYDEAFLSESEADAAYETLLKSTAWEKTSKINRYVALHEETIDGDQGTNPYQYRDAPDAGQRKLPFSESINAICSKAETWYNSKRNSDVKFNVCLLNFYEDGTQRIGWHCDREEIGRDTPIASISLGAKRDFQIRAKEGLERTSLNLAHGSLVVMENVCQLKYLHCLPKMAAVKEGRINLTFRCKTADMPGEDEHANRDKWMEHITHGAAATDMNYALASKAEGSDGGTAVFGDILETEEELQDNLQAMTVVYTIKTNIGAEGYAAAEAMELLNKDADMWSVVPRPFGVAGYVAVGRKRKDTADSEDDIAVQKAAVQSLLKLRSALHVMQYHDHFDLAEVAAASEMEIPKVGGEELYQFYKKRLMDKTAIIPTLEPAPDDPKEKTTFRVTCERIGSHHNFQAPNVEFEVGGAMSEYFDNIKPKMEDFDVNIRVDVIGTRVIVGTQQNFVELAKRHFYRYRNKVTIKANMAYVMLRCANLQPGKVLLDPFCGSATILLEAMEIEPSIRCIGLDVNRRSVQGSQDNAEAASVHNRCEFHCVDVRGLRKFVADQSVDCIVSNLPWGVQTAHKKSVTDLQSLYEQFLRSSWYILKEKGRIIMLVLRGLQLTRILRKLGGRYRILRANVLRTSNNLPCLVVVEKIQHDLLNEAIKGQLAFMSEYVSVSREMYHAIHNEDIATGLDVPEPESKRGGG